MNLGPLIMAVGLAAITGEARSAVQNVRRRMASAIATGLLLLIATGFALGALTDWLAGELGTTWALGAVATGLGLLAFAIRGLRSLFEKRRPKPRQPQGPLAELAQTLEADGRPGSELVTMAVVALAGFLLARQVGRS